MASTFPTEVKVAGRTVQSWEAHNQFITHDEWNGLLGHVATFINVRSHLAALDGVTDDSDAFASAIAAAGSGPARIVIPGPMRLTQVHGIDYPRIMLDLRGGGAFWNEALLYVDCQVVADNRPIFCGSGGLTLWPNGGNQRPVPPHWFGASGSQRTTTGSIGAGAALLTVASVTDFQPGQGIVVIGAGAAGAYLLTKVKSIAGNVLTLANNASTTVSGAAVYHDDGAALQATISAASGGQRIDLGVGYFNAVQSLTIANQIGVHLIGQGPYTQIIKPAYSTDRSWVLSVNGLKHVVRDLKILGAYQGTPPSATDYSADIALYVRGTPQAGMSYSTYECRFQNLELGRARVALQLGNKDVDSIDPDINGNTFEQIRMMECNTGYKAAGFNIHQNPHRNCFYSGRDYNVRLVDCGLVADNSYFSVAYDSLTNAYPGHTNPKIQATGTCPLILRECRSEDSGHKRDFCRLDAIATSSYSSILLENCSITHGSGSFTRGSETQRSFLFKTASAPSAGQLLSRVVFIGGEIEGYVEVDGVNLVSIGTHMLGGGPGVVDGVKRGTWSGQNYRPLEFIANPQEARRAQPMLSADRGDANVTLTVAGDDPVQRFATTLTANRTVTLSTTGAVRGDNFRIVRTGLGSFTLAVGSLKTIPSATAAFVDVAFDGTNWVLTGYGTL